MAAYAYKQLAGREIDTVILIGPAHQAALTGASVYSEGSLRTPLGLVKVNEKLARSLLNEKARVTFDRSAYAKEHSLEVQLPFLQKTVKNFTIVPILIGMPTREMFAHLEEKLAAILRENEQTIIVASTDLSHYHDAATAVTLDKKTIAQYVKQGTTPAPVPADTRLQANGATFVTINRQGGLRGCIGNIEPIMPLYQSVIQNAVSASSRDPRFPPMKEGELKDMQVEVSVLSPLVELRDVRDIRIGTHGLLLVHKAGSGLLLPQVPVEFGWDVPTFLKQLSYKAGLPENAWKEGQLYGFTADVIH